VLYQHPIDRNAVSRRLRRANRSIIRRHWSPRDLIQRTGGFCTGLPFFGRHRVSPRAATIGPIGNTAEFIYVYRTRSDSLTGSEETGIHTAVRRDLWAIQHPRAQWIADRVNAGLGPVLAPMAMTSPATLFHISGPALLGVDGQPWPPNVEPEPEPAKARSTARRKRTASSPPRPVFIIGAPRSGTSILALAIAQLPVFKLTLDPSWLPQLSSALHLAFTSVEENETVDDLHIQRVDTEQFAAHFGAAAHDLLLRGIDPAVAAPFEDERLRQLRTQVARTSTRVLAEGDVLAVHGFDLYRLFPHARFIHVLRNPDEVVAAHQRDRKMLYRTRFVYMDEERAYDRWIESVKAARDLEIALGAEKVMRVDRAALRRTGTDLDGCWFYRRPVDRGVRLRLTRRRPGVGEQNVAADSLRNFGNPSGSGARSSVLSSWTTPVLSAKPRENRWGYPPAVVFRDVSEGLELAWPFGWAMRRADRAAAAARGQRATMSIVLSAHVAGRTLQPGFTGFGCGLRLSDMDGRHPTWLALPCPHAIAREQSAEALHGLRSTVIRP